MKCGYNKCYVIISETLFENLELRDNVLTNMPVSDIKSGIICQKYRSNTGKI